MTNDERDVLQGVIWILTFSCIFLILVTTWWWAFWDLSSKVWTAVGITVIVFAAIAAVIAIVLDK